MPPVSSNAVQAVQETSNVNGDMAEAFLVSSLPFFCAHQQRTSC